MLLGEEEEGIDDRSHPGSHVQVDDPSPEEEGEVDDAANYHGGSMGPGGGGNDHHEEDGGSSLVCPFTFESGISKVKVPNGCVFFGVNDVNNEAQKAMSSPAVYVCAPMENPADVSAEDLKSYGLVSNGGKSLISMIQPGGSVTVEFYSGDHLSAHRGSFTLKKYTPLFEFKYPKTDEFANDNVLSARVTSTTKFIPSACEELKFSEKMHLVASASTKAASKKLSKLSSKASKASKVSKKASLKVSKPSKLSHKAKSMEEVKDGEDEEGEVDDYHNKNHFGGSHPPGDDNGKEEEGEVDDYQPNHPPVQSHPPSDDDYHKKHKSSKKASQKK